MCIFHWNVKYLWWFAHITPVFNIMLVFLFIVSPARKVIPKGIYMFHDFHQLVIFLCRIIGAPDFESQKGKKNMIFVMSMVTTLPL